MGMRKDYYLRGAAQTLAMVKAVYLHNLVFERGVLPAAWVKKSVQVTAFELDEAGIRVRQHDDTYDFLPDSAGADSELSRCFEVVDQWRIEALEKIESKSLTVVALAKACNISRQSLYRIVKHNSRGLQHYFTLRGREPILLWRGKSLAAEYARCRVDLERAKIMGRLA